jgi:hypothetical protein
VLRGKAMGFLEDRGFIGEQAGRRRRGGYFAVGSDGEVRDRQRRLDRKEASRFLLWDEDAARWVKRWLAA